jgi:hypothetical protein
MVMWNDQLEIIDYGEICNAQENEIEVVR